MILLTVFIFSTSSFAANISWSDLQEESEYKLTENILFENGVTLPDGDIYKLSVIEPLSIPGYPMFYFGFDKKDCTNPEMTADLSIFSVPTNEGDLEVGAELEVQCRLGLYLEVKDYYSSSAFSE